jgi:hypothetical protein
VIFSPKIIKNYQIVCTRETKSSQLFDKKTTKFVGKKKTTGYSKKCNYFFIYIFFWSQVLWELKSTKTLLGLIIVNFMLNGLQIVA